MTLALINVADTLLPEHVFVCLSLLDFGSAERCKDCFAQVNIPGLSHYARLRTILAVANVADNPLLIFLSQECVSKHAYQGKGLLDCNIFALEAG